MKFILLSHQRSGTHMLGSALSTHPNLKFIDVEVILHLNSQKRGEYFHKWYYDKNNNNYDGIIIQTSQVIQSKHLLIELLKHKNDINIVHLYRQNVLAKLVSGMIAKKTNKWRVYNTDKFDEYNGTIHVHPQHLSQTHMRYQGELAFVEMLNMSSIYRVQYEELIENPNMFNELQKFLDLKIMNIKPLTIKQINRPLHIIVKNYHELKKIFLNTKLQGCFNEH